jgi:hypothetical protein
MSFLKDLKVVLILILLLVILLTQIKGCKTNGEAGDTLIDVDTVYKEVKVEVPKYVPKWRTKVEEIEVQVEVEKLIPVDTTAILKDYFAKYKTVDTLNLPYSDSINKTFGYGVVTDIITKNEIIERSVSWNYKIPEITKTITIYPSPVNQVYAGVSSAFNQENFVDNVSGGLILKTKKDQIYQASIGLGNRGGTVAPFIGAGIYWKIRLKKPKVTDLIP